MSEATPDAHALPGAAPAVRPESAWAARVRLVAIAVFAVTMFLPVMRASADPRRPYPRSLAPAAQRRLPVLVPLEQVANGAEWLDEGGAIEALWRTRAWYPYLLLPAWLGALALGASGPRGRRAAGVLIFATTAGVLAFEVAYVRADFGGILAPSLRWLEIGCAWAVVTAVLVWRRHGRSLFDAPAGISALALLAALHGFTFMGEDLRAWSAGGAGLSAMANGIAANYFPAFWVAEAALFVAAAPAYLPRRASPVENPVATPAEALTRGPA